ncbi:hypothetical protein BDR26DRAFT_850701 [Obelidium mucronatum]|nr:hypothetical protein BDR26DRAFT_850701 [Obelidium mucronatum]
MQFRQQHQQQQQHPSPFELIHLDLNFFPPTTNTTTHSPSCPSFIRQEPLSLPMNFFLSPSPSVSPSQTPLLGAFPDAESIAQHPLLRAVVPSLPSPTLGQAEEVSRKSSAAVTTCLEESSAANTTPSTTATATRPAQQKRKISKKKTKAVKEPAPNTRFKATEMELDFLYAEFERDPFPSAADRNRIAESLGMEARQVQFWFQNRRANAKAKGIVLTPAKK